MKSSILIALCVLGSVLCQAASKPNVVIILADDMGYSDIGCYGSEIATPSLDSLAKNGVRFTQFYNAARCCPTRAELLTGLFAHQACIGLMATCVDVSKAAYPKEFKGENIKPLEGVSLMPAFLGENLQRSAPLAWEHHGNSALRDGKWKIVTEFRANQPTKWELYDMDADRTELRDIAAAQPEKLKELVGKWQAWADRVGVQPWPLKRPGK
ncbi:MAG: hypothetical protein B9S33_01330 [Pedosphaera sp. Tous-C6FEB]|nr:MAG: hypothetical protein B9S33_01330 [Pedosphaera sp. Tous-C6FEB]